MFSTYLRQKKASKSHPVKMNRCQFVTIKYNRENETYNFLKRNVQFSLFFHPIKAKAFNHHLSGN